MGLTEGIRRRAQDRADLLIRNAEEIQELRFGGPKGPVVPKIGLIMDFARYDGEGASLVRLMCLKLGLEPTIKEIRASEIAWHDLSRLSGVILHGTEMMPLAMQRAIARKMIELPPVTVFAFDMDPGMLGQAGLIDTCFRMSLYRTLKFDWDAKRPSPEQVLWHGMNIAGNLLHFQPQMSEGALGVVRALSWSKPDEEGDVLKIARQCVEDSLTEGRTLIRHADAYEYLARSRRLHANATIEGLCLAVDHANAEHIG